MRIAGLKFAHSAHYAHSAQSAHSARATHPEQAEHPIPRPTLDQLKAELNREQKKLRSNRFARNAVWTIVVVAASTVLAATIAFPVLRISGSSMTPTLAEGDVVVALSGGYSKGDVVAINYGSRILVKRLIAGPGEWVDISDNGTVYVNGVKVDEPYVDELALGKCDISMPYQVPDDSWFVMGDHRETSVDSRTASVGAISSSDIVGKIFLRTWPFNSIGLV
jgi:signal peptidase I